MHHDNEIGDSGKPEINQFYNKTKAGFDALDQKVYHYTTYRKTSRWLCSVFYNILALLTYNAFVLYKLQPPVVLGLSMTSRARFQLLCALDEQLIKPNKLNRTHYPNRLNVPTVRALEALDRKVRQQCKECKGNVCKKHSKTILVSNDCFTA